MPNVKDNVVDLYEKLGPTKSQPGPYLHDILALKMAVKNRISD